MGLTKYYYKVLLKCSQEYINMSIKYLLSMEYVTFSLKLIFYLLCVFEKSSCPCRGAEHL